MSANGKGTVKIGVPMWYSIDGTGKRMYSATAENRCESTCMRVKESSLQADMIVVEYEDMPDSCIKNQAITIVCKHFYNPITPEEWGPFSIQIFDSEQEMKEIE
jgi:hypothetical protein